MTARPRRAAAGASRSGGRSTGHRGSPTARQTRAGSCPSGGEWWCRTGSYRRLDGNGALLVGAEQADIAGAVGAAVAESETAAAAHVEGVLRVLAVRAGDHEAVFVVGDGHHLVHVL